MGSLTAMGSTIMGFSCDSPWTDVRNQRNELFRPLAVPEHVETMGDSKRTKGNYGIRLVKKKGRSMFQEVYLKINGKWVQRVVIALVSTFDQKIIIFEELKENFIKKYQNYPLYIQ